MFELFEVKDGMLVLNNDVVRGIRPFKTLLEKDRGGKIDGDHDGRKKFYAHAQFMYMYLANHPNSILADAPIDQLHDLAVEKSGLPEGWKKGKLYKEVEEAYVEGLELTSTYKAYIEAKRTLYSIGDDMVLFSKQRDRIKKSLESVNTQLENTDMDSPDYKEIIAREEMLTQRLMKVTAEIQGITDRLPNNYNTINELKKIIVKENEQKAGIRGGGKLGNREQ